MSDREWLKWIKPAPKGEVEVAALENSLLGLVDTLETFVNTPSSASIRAALTGMQVHVNALKGCVRRLPVKDSYRLNLQNLITPVESLDYEIKSRLSLLGPGREGGQTDEIKRLCIMLCMGFLQDRGKRHGRHPTGAVVGLSMWAWKAAGGKSKSGIYAWHDLADEVALQIKNEMENPT